MIAFIHHIKFFKSVIFEGTSFGPKKLLNKHSTGADVALLDEKTLFNVPMTKNLFSNSTRKCTFV